MIRRLAKATVEATAYFALGVAACALHYFSSGKVTEFACRWDGECYGWTRSLVIRDALGDLEYWWAYCGISTAILRFHPTVEHMVLARVTVRLTWAFIITCGSIHLVMAYADFNPVYRFLATWKNVTGPISMLAFFFVCFGLIRTFVRVTADRERLAELEARAR